jgi:hypothetical protein
MAMAAADMIAMSMPHFTTTKALETQFLLQLFPP